MAARGTVYQLKESFSVPSIDFLTKVVYNEELSKKDLRVCIFLLTQLEGCREEEMFTIKDRRNFRKIDIKTISLELHMSKSDVKEVVDHLCEQNILQEGSGPTIDKGYRFTF